jgi:hypothetical protein
MNKLIQELQRLYFLDSQAWRARESGAGDHPADLAGSILTPELVARSLAGEAVIELDLVNPDNMVRAMVLDFASAADWEAVARLYEGMQEDLELPAPAVAVSGRSGYQLWLSLAECVPAAEASLFLTALRDKYLVNMPLAKLGFHPDSGRVAGGPGFVALVPALHETTGQWSAFIDPSMGSMFVDESGLDMAPNPDRQADMLSGLASIKAADFQRVLASLQSAVAADAKRREESAAAPGGGRIRSGLNVGNHYVDPKSFLLAVMNDASASAGQRIKAAKALLPYFNPTEHE